MFWVSIYIYLHLYCYVETISLTSLNVSDHNDLGKTKYMWTESDHNAADYVCEYKSKSHYHVQPLSNVRDTN